MSLADLVGRGERVNAAASDHYAAILETTDDAVVATSLDGTILSWNAGAERMYGFAAEEVLGQRVSLFVPADRAGEVVRMHHAIAQGERVDRLETVRTRRDGTRFDASMTAWPVRDASGRVTSAFVVTRDNGAAKHTEVALRASQADLVQALERLDKAEQLSRTGTWALELGRSPALTCSTECTRVLGIAPDVPLSIESFFAHVHPDDRAGLSAAMKCALSEHRIYETEYRIVLHGGATRWLHVWAEPEYDDRGEPAVVGVVQDITDRCTADEALRASERRLRLLAENARDLIFRQTLLPEPRFEYVSPASLAITGFTPEELYEDANLAAGLMDSAQLGEIKKRLRDGGLFEPVDVAVRRKDGSIVWVSQQLTFVRDDTGAVIAVEGITRDITERKQAEEELAYAGFHDSLTGLPNRLLLRDRVELARVRAAAEGSSVVAVALDLDDFTLINDTLGYDTGDAVLVGVARLLSSATNGRASVARTGSDEFIVVGEDIIDDGAVAFVARVRDALLRPIRCNGVDTFVHARIGVAVDEPGAAPDSLLRNATVALSRAKQKRTGSGVEFFDSAMRSRNNERFALVGDLHRALARDEFVLHYQPIVRLSDNRVVGTEALIRWRHPEHGLMNPADFIPLAEDTGLIVDIGAWVLDTACLQLRAFSDADAQLADLGVSVNVSVKQLRSPSIVATVTRALGRSGIEPGRLTIEMTESVFVDDLDAIRTVLAQLRRIGVRIAVDDFGTGYSSLVYLKHLPLNTLKIDQNFVEGLGSDPCDAAIVTSALSLSSALGLFAVAEGVETAEQLAALRDLGCDAAQGFYFSKPVAGTEVVALLRSGLPT